MAAGRNLSRAFGCAFNKLLSFSERLSDSLTLLRSIRIAEPVKVQFASRASGPVRIRGDLITVALLVFLSVSVKKSLRKSSWAASEELHHDGSFMSSFVLSIAFGSPSEAACRTRIALYSPVLGVLEPSICTQPRLYMSIKSSCREIAPILAELCIQPSPVRVLLGGSPRLPAGRIFGQKGRADTRPDRSPALLVSIHSPCEAPFVQFRAQELVCTGSSKPRPSVLLSEDACPACLLHRPSPLVSSLFVGLGIVFFWVRLAWLLTPGSRNVQRGRAETCRDRPSHVETCRDRPSHVRLGAIKASQASRWTRRTHLPLPSLAVWSSRKFGAWSGETLLLRPTPTSVQGERRGDQARS